MTELTPPPTRLLKLAAKVASWSLGLLAAAWLVLAVVWGTLHGWIVPRIGEYRPWLETQASQALGLPVRIGSISAQSTGLIPSFALRDVALLDAQGRTALLLPQVTVALSPASLLKRGFEQLVIDQPTLDIRRSADGHLFIAGLDMLHTGSSDGQAMDWLFAQTELVVRGGTVRWTDAQRNAPPLALHGVDLVMRNRGLGHSLRLDASPPADWGDRFTARARLRQPLLSTHRGRWQDWSGPVYASLPRVDVLQLRQYADLGFDLAQGVGALRVWADVRHGQLDGGTADLALQDVQMTLAPGLQPLALTALQGRLAARRLHDGTEFSTEGLQFTTADGLSWPGGNLFASLRDGDKRTPAQGQFRADRLDLATLARIASSLPLGATTHAALATYAPAGLVEQINASWRGALPEPAQFEAQGRITGLALAAEPAPAATAAVPHPLGRPGVRGATLDFALTQAGGKATLALGAQEPGSLEFPGVFDEPVVPFDQLSASLAWQPQAHGWAVQANDLRFANADGAGELKLSWRHGDPAQASSHARSPGVLDLQGQLTRANLARVHRYIPLELDAEVRHYVRDAVLAGTSNKVRFSVKGDLWDFPFNTSRQGEFHLAAEVQNASYAYVPPGLASTAHPGPHWPALEQLNGELVFDRASMQVHRASGKLRGAPGVQISQAEVQVADLKHTQVDFKAQARGPLADMLGVLARSPLAGSSAKTLEQASVNGMADLKLALQLPIAQIDKSKAQGSLTLPGNDLQVSPDTPALGKVQGVLNFTESGFSVAAGQARLLGGDVKIDSAVPSNATPDASPLLRLQGVATAEGLRQAAGLGPVPWLAQHASGSTAYTAVLGLRRGVPEFNVRSSLQGLALNLPAPLGKSADTALPLRVDNALLPGSSGPLRDHLSVALGNTASVAYVRDISGAQAKVLRGVVTVGPASGEAVALPGDGVSANLNLGSANADAWDDLLSNSHAKGSDNSADGYLPTQLTLRAQALTVGGRTLHTLVLGGSRDASTWRANVDAQELSGYLEYRLPADANGGRLYARLARLNLAPGETAGVDPLQSSPLDNVPALDIVVDALQLKDKKLGRFEVDAVNRRSSSDAAGRDSREWRLNKLSLSNPDAQLNATGNWVATGAQTSQAGPRRTVLNFKLDIADAGALLGRLGMPGVIRRGKGVMEGQAAWTGSPLALDTPTLGGQFNLALDNGQFLKADPGLAKLLGVLNLQALPRRLTLDFRDVFSEGFAFDFVRGDVRIAQGTATTNNLQMKGVNAAVLMDGSADIGQETQNLKVVVVPDLNAGTASLVAAVINPAIGLGSFLAQWFLKRPLTEAATQEFHIDGTWADPKITKVPHSPRTQEAQAPTTAGTTP